MCEHSFNLLVCVHASDGKVAIDVDVSCIHHFLLFVCVGNNGDWIRYWVCQWTGHWRLSIFGNGNMIIHIIIIMFEL